MKESLEKPSSIKVGNLKEMHEILDSAKAQILNQKEVNNLTRPITNAETEIVMRLPIKKSKKSPGSDGSSAEFYQTFKKELQAMPLKY